MSWYSCPLPPARPGGPFSAGCCTIFPSSPLPPCCDCRQFDKYPPRGEMADINSIVERELRAGGAAPDRGVRRRLARQLEAAGEQAPQAEQEEQAEQEDPPAPAAAASAPQGSGEERQVGWARAGLRVPCSPAGACAAAAAHRAPAAALRRPSGPGARPAPGRRTTKSST